MPQQNTEKLSKEEIEILLVEYQKAQDSAEHHDTLLWTVSGLVLVALTIFFQSITKDVLASVLGLILLFALWVFANSFRYYKNISYNRCKDIEKTLGMNHHITKMNFCISQWNIFLTLLILFGLIYLHIIHQNIIASCNFT